ncbi:MAG TPA: hemerythrin family protein [Methylocystis sp.]|nr:hemerythrin family protein [Methylocystis sp.]
MTPEIARGGRGGRLTEEHEALMEQVDHVTVNVQRAPIETRQVVDALERLFDLTKSHFSHEEQIMLEMQYQGLPSHRRDHVYLLEMLRKFIELAEHDPTHLTPGIGTSLRSWIALHIKKFDDTYLVWAAEARDQRPDWPESTPSDC